MKILMKTASAVLIIFFLTSCSGKLPALKDRVSGETGYTGTIESLSLDVYKAGTHIIRTEDGETIAIQSPAISLSNYLGKKVFIEGSLAKLIDGKNQVFTVSKIRLADASLNGITEHISRKYGFKFSYPAMWALSEETGKIILKNSGKDAVQIEVLDAGLSLGAFALASEGSAGTPVTVGSQSSLRYILPDKIKVYIHNQSANKFYAVIFYDSGNTTDTNLFYSLLETFVTTTGAAPDTGAKCGGPADTACQEGYVCQLSGSSKEAEGICVPLNAGTSGADCPYTPVPENCAKYQAKEVSKLNCPLSYECMDAQGGTAETGIPAVGGSAAADIKKDAGQVFLKYYSKILPQGAVLISLEMSEQQKLIIAVYSLDTGQFRTVYDFVPSVNEYSYTKKAHYYKDPKKGWVLQSGEDVKIPSALKTIDITGAADNAAGSAPQSQPATDDASIAASKKTSQTDMSAGASAMTSINVSAPAVLKTADAAKVSSPPAVALGMRLYANTQKNYSMSYPKNWYYRSFGAIKGAIWYTGFADRDFDSESDVIISVSVLSGAGTNKKEMKGADYLVTVPRDLNSHFLVKGPLVLKDTVDAMAATVAAGK